MVLLNKIGGIEHPSFKLTPYVEEIIGDDKCEF
jgi:hypothetical protein